jgi:hypothetical protein
MVVSCLGSTFVRMMFDSKKVKLNKFLSSTCWVQCVKRMCMQEHARFSSRECSWFEKLQFYVEAGNLPEILFQRLKEEGSKPILVHGNFGDGKMALVRYVLQKHAKDLDPLFPGGIFHMKYDPKGEQLLESQRELLRTLVQDPCKV